MICKKSLFKLTLVFSFLMMNLSCNAEIKQDSTKSIDTFNIYNKSENHKFFTPVIKELLTRGADTTFVDSLLLHPEAKFYKKILKMPVVIFTDREKGIKTVYSRKYRWVYNKKAIRTAKQFMKDHKYHLDSAEKLFNVDKEVIAAILWTETRFGSFTGKHHVASSFLTTAMYLDTQYVEWNKKLLYKNRRLKNQKRDTLDKKIWARAKKKSEWAINELLALEEMQEKSPYAIHDLSGSWAGAFGYSQFLPSSYIKWSYDGNGDGAVDLFHVEDAIFSIGNYLKENGWGKTKKQQQAAVFHYNNSSAYVSAVLRLARNLKKYKL